MHVLCMDLGLPQAVSETHVCSGPISGCAYLWGGIQQHKERHQSRGYARHILICYLLIFWPDTHAFLQVQHGGDAAPKVGVAHGASVKRVRKRLVAGDALTNDAKRADVGVKLPESVGPCPELLKHDSPTIM